MTCIVSLVEDSIVYMAADSAAVAGIDLQLRADEKVFRRGPFLIGFTTSFRMGQILRYHLQAPARPREQGIRRYMTTTFVDKVRECLKDGGWAARNNEREEGGAFIVGYRGRLFRIEDDYQVALLEDNFTAIGSGQAYAIGALAVSSHLPPEERLLAALKTSERFCTEVRAPFRFYRLAPRRAAWEPGTAPVR